jgi:N-acetylmuramoyl-L-alanine amidase
MATALSLGVDYALIETCFYDNAGDMAIYNANKDGIAHAIAGGIVEGFGLGKVESKPAVKEEPKKEEPASNIRYCVQVGAFSKKENAENLLKNLKGDGYNGFIVTKTV